MESHRFCFSPEGYLHSLYYKYFLIWDQKKKKGRAFTAIHRINTFYKGIYGENKQSNVAIPYTLILSDVSFTNFLILQRATVLQFWSWGPGTSFKETLSLWFPKSCMQKKKKKKSFAFKWVHALKSLTENQRNENEKKNLKRTLREFKVGDIMAKILEGCEDC